MFTLLEPLVQMLKCSKFKWQLSSKELKVLHRNAQTSKPKILIKFYSVEVAGIQDRGKKLHCKTCWR